uniref:Ubiquitinyl hydrolase 1 n=2 Tax=Bursaphelenchus xylophilus TaxID=6326 RepID=A0A1I7SU78_BURXY
MDETEESKEQKNLVTPAASTSKPKNLDPNPSPFSIHQAEGLDQLNYSSEYGSFTGQNRFEEATVSVIFLRSEDEGLVTSSNLCPAVLAGNSFQIEHLVPFYANDTGMTNTSKHAKGIAVLGENFTRSVPECQRKVEELFGTGDIQPFKISQILTMMVISDHSDDHPLTDPENFPWDPNVFYETINMMLPGLNWKDVLEGMDNPYFTVKSNGSFRFLFTLFKLAFTDKEFPINVLYTPWKNNKAGHLSCLNKIIYHRHIFDLRDYPHTLTNISCLKVMPDENDREVLVWRMIELVDCLFQLGENTSLSQLIFAMFKTPVNVCPDIFCLTVAQLQSHSTQFRVYVLKLAVTQLLSGHQNAVPVLNFIWTCENMDAFKSMLLSAFTEYYTSQPEDQSRLTKILEIAHELKPNGLGELFKTNHYTFLIDLACLAARRDFLKLDKFLDDKLNEVGDPFAQHLLHFLRRKCTLVNSEISQIIFTALYARVNTMSWLLNDMNSLLNKNLLPASVRVYYNSNGLLTRSTPSVPNSMDFRPTGRDIGQGGGGPTPAPSMATPYAAEDDLTNAVFSDTIQTQANTYFQQIYDCNNPLQVNEFLRTMKRFSISNNTQEKELLSCLLKNLFDEFRFFAEYPERELKTTAKVYGGIIREGIVLNMKFATAIRRILEALHAPRATLLNMFGIVAINECRAILHKYTKICQTIHAMPAFEWFPEDLKEYIVSGIQGVLPPNHVAQNELQLINENARTTPSNNHGQATTPVAGMRFAPRNNTGQSLGVTNCESLIQATRAEGREIEAPDSTVEERVSFLCNNLTLSTMPAKCEEMKELIRSQNRDILIPWLAQYLVMKRVSMEPNLQNVYNSFLISVKDEKLDEAILTETYRSINVLLRSDMRRAASNFTDRMLLKNLGFWLGFITIARDEPILYDELNIKGLLMDAFFRGQHELLYVVPFVTKVLISTAKSVAFSPRCTWINGILKVLAEIHNEPDLKLNLKFEIEVLCKDLQLHLKDIEITGVLKDQSRLPNLFPQRTGFGDVSPTINGFGSHYRTPTEGLETQRIQMSSIMSNTIPSSSANGTFSQTPGHGMPSFPAGSAPTPSSLQSTFVSSSSNHYGPYVDQGDTDWTQFLNTLDMIIGQMQAPTHLKAMIRHAVSHAVREMVGGITDRAIAVAVTATEALVKKDFALNPDELQMRRAAQQMMRNMTAGMAMISCRDPLLQAMQAYLRNLLAQNNQQIDLPKTAEEILTASTEATIECATNYVVKCACEKGLREIDRRMEKEYMTRRLCRQEGRPYKADPSLVALNPSLPEPLRRLPGTNDEASFKVYEDFHKPLSLSLSETPSEMIEEFRRPVQQFDRAPSANQMEYANRLVSQPAVVRPRPASVENLGSFPNGNGDVGNLSSRPSSFINPIEQRRGGDEFQGKVESILREWINMCYQPNIARDPQPALTSIVNMMRENGILVTDEMITQFFKVCADICFDVAYRLLRNENSGNLNVKQRCYFTLDAFVRLTCLMIKYSADGNHSTKLNLLKRVLAIITQAVMSDHDHKQTDFNGMPFMRIIIQMFNELTTEDPALDPISWDIVECFFQALFIIQPRRVPGFVFHWLEIIGHRIVLTRLFQGRYDFQRSTAVYIQLLVSHLRFLGPFLRSSRIHPNIHELYKGTLRIMFVILHDFPEILCEYHYVLCDVIQPNCIQLRNLVLSAYPKDLMIPDPISLSKESIEKLPEMNEDPKLHREMSSLVSKEIGEKLDEYLKRRVQVSFLTELPSILMLNPSQGCKYNISTVNAVVVHVGTRAIDQLHEKSLSINMTNVMNTAFMDIFQSLAASLCTQGRYLLFNAIANQLRYPNSHTNYFSCVILVLFLHAHNSEVQEQITRTLFERLVAQKPHPWGLLITFVELIRNPQYNFWKHNFVHCATDIEG